MLNTNVLRNEKRRDRGRAKRVYYNLSVSKRLRRARIDAGFRSAKAAAEALGIPYPTYAGHENGARGIKTNELRLYANKFGVSETWLLFEAPQQQREVKLLGSIQGATFQLSVGKGSLSLELPIESPTDTRAITCVDESLSPIYMKGDVLLVHESAITTGQNFRAVAELKPHGVVVGRLLEFKSSHLCHFQLTSGQVVLDAEFKWVKKIIGITSPLTSLHASPTALANNHNRKVRD